MSLFLSCGHECVPTRDGDHGIPLSLKGTEVNPEGEYPTVSFGVYCSTCADSYLKTEDVLKNKEEEDSWLQVSLQGERRD